MGKEIYLHDMVATRAEYWFKPPAFVTRFLENNLNDVRDMEIAYLLFNIIVTMYPALIALFTVLPPSHLLGAAYLVVFNVMYLQRFILAMHYSTHKRLFKPGFWSDIVNKSIIVLVAPIFGIPSNTYWLHHIVMHHVDNNEWNKDLSATEGYQRDNFLHWIVYWVRFMAGSWVELPYYALKKRRWGLFAQCGGGMAATLGALVYLWGVNSTAACWTVIAPFVVVSTAMMFGKGAQGFIHSFTHHHHHHHHHRRHTLKPKLNRLNSLSLSRSLPRAFFIICHLCGEKHVST